MLCYGAVLGSEKSPVEELGIIFEKLVEISSKRSYLSVAAIKFLVDYLPQIDENDKFPQIPNKGDLQVHFQRKKLLTEDLGKEIAEILMVSWTQCCNFTIFLPLRFFVKSILVSFRFYVKSTFRASKCVKMAAFALLECLKLISCKI